MIMSSWTEWPLCFKEGCVMTLLQFSVAKYGNVVMTFISGITMVGGKCQLAPDEVNHKQYPCPIKQVAFY